MRRTNNQLIGGTGLIYNSRYYDPSLAMSQPFAKAQNNILATQNRRRANKAAAEAKVESYIESMAAAPNLGKVPAKYRDVVNKFLIEQRREYSRYARIASQYKPGTTAYMDAVSKMNSVSSAFTNLSNQFDAFKKMKDEDLPNFSDRLLSEGNNETDINILSDILTDKFDLQIGEAGILTFFQQRIAEDGNSFIVSKELSNLPKYFNKDFETATKIVDLNKSIYNKGEKFTPESRNFIELQIRNLINKGGRDTLLSLATDDFIIQGGLGLDQALLDDPERHSELQEIVVNQYVDMMEKSAEAGFNVSEEKRKRLERSRRRTDGSSSVGGFSFTPGQAQDILLNQEFANQIKGRASDMFKRLNDPSFLANFDGRFDELADLYIKTVAMNDPDKASRYISRAQHYEMFKKQNAGLDNVEQEYNKRYSIDDKLFVNLTGQGRDLGNPYQYQPVDPFVNSKDFNQFYRDLLITSGISPDTANYFVYGIGGKENSENTSSDEGVLDVD